MTNLEQQVWAAAFAEKFKLEYEFNSRVGSAVDGFYCAEIADLAVEKLREALQCEDREYLMPVKEGFADACGDILRQTNHKYLGIGATDKRPPPA